MGRDKEYDLLVFLAYPRGWSVDIAEKKPPLSSRDVVLQRWSKMVVVAAKRDIY